MEETREPENVALGQAIRQLRDDAGLTQEELAGRADVPLAELRQIEGGEVDADWGTLRRLSQAMGVELADLFRLAQKREGER